MKPLFLITPIIFMTLFVDSSCKKSKTTAVTSPAVYVPVTLEELLVKTPIVERKFYNAKHEPVKGILHGAGQDYNGFSDYAFNLGRTQHPLLYMDYIGLTSTKQQIDNWGIQLKNNLTRLPNDVMPQIGLSMTGGNDNGSGKTIEVARGDYDVQITAFAQAIKNLGRKNYVRIGYEFEGSWNGYNAQGYKDAFIRITTELRRVDTTTATVWCSGGGSAGFMPWNNLINYYPGDAWVDWWGVDIFSPEELTDQRLVAFLTKADEYKKPVMIGEATPRYVGTLDGKVSWEGWFRPYFELLYANPQIKATCYINWDWAYWSNQLGFPWHNWKDGRIEKNEVVKAGYIQEKKKPVFIHSQ
jgi:hypothetical protein